MSPIRAVAAAAAAAQQNPAHIITFQVGSGAGGEVPFVKDVLSLTSSTDLRTDLHRVEEVFGNADAHLHDSFADAKDAS